MTLSNYNSPRSFLLALAQLVQDALTELPDEAAQPTQANAQAYSTEPETTVFILPLAKWLKARGIVHTVEMPPQNTRCWSVTVPAKTLSAWVTAHSSNDRVHAEYLVKQLGQDPLILTFHRLKDVRRFEEECIAALANQQGQDGQPFQGAGIRYA